MSKARFYVVSDETHKAAKMAAVIIGVSLSKFVEEALRREIMRVSSTYTADVKAGQ